MVKKAIHVHFDGVQIIDLDGVQPNLDGGHLDGGFVFDTINNVPINSYANIEMFTNTAMRLRRIYADDESLEGGLSEYLLSITEEATKSTVVERKKARYLKFQTELKKLERDETYDQGSLFNKSINTKEARSIKDFFKNQIAGWRTLVISTHRAGS